MSIQIFILSKLMEDNTYPYKLKKQLSEPIPLDQLGGLTESKLYYHFDSLAKKGLIETVEIIKEEHRPDKQVFRITDKGRKELPKKIYKLFESADAISDMVVALANLKYVDPKKVIEILEKKLQSFTERWDYIKGYENHIPKDTEKENLVEFFSGYFSSRAEHTVHWLEELIQLIKKEEL
ncbi:MULTISPECIES: PadR family transcriptional regulator [Bacillus cereus group]|uniref:PadR family transcriptional regulator n=1 Tax=Bacillus cereus group TaxID=86661 RepID=UPI00044C637F|nr:MULTISPECIES: PadR family transcriptional regulator [Bacillus cereus group]EXY05687.1 transcriptional regulator [Bacillus thuringiensis]MEB8632522.1 PadR family transcriptional regulator [Bacillus cereus]MEB8745921.1 PadR family transcriptional regulator [Bacillus cereus]MEB8799290.1 PadR family transcriptional regulator [Bacillus cereus]MEB8809120.1 PadR family transcriptional regulator [Bacillus cereus]